MKKAAKVEYGITIVKPWSKAMYDHNDAVADVVRELLLTMWFDALDAAEAELESEDEVVELSELDWNAASEEMIRIQKAVTCYGFGFGYDINKVSDRVEEEIESAPYYRLKEIAEDLGLELEKGFVGFS